MAGWLSDEEIEKIKTCVLTPSMEKVRDMTKEYFASGGLEVQYNVVDTETLRAAQRDPGKYRDLVVRIAGYSAYFVELGTDLQNDIISRNENRF